MRRRRLVATGNRGQQATPALGKVAVEVPEAPQRAGNALNRFARRRLLQTIEGRAEIVMLGLEPINPPLRVGADMRLRLLGQRQEELGMAVADGVRLG